MKKWSMLLVIAIVALIMPTFSASVNAQDETGLTISKSADPSSAHPGTTITYTITIASTGSDNISNINLADDMFDTSGLEIPTSLAAGENTTVTATYTVTEDDLKLGSSIVNTANVTGTDSLGNPLTASDTATVELTYTASLQLTKTADPTTASPGNNITYTYTIINNGDTTISNISLEDDKLGPISDNITLAPGENVAAIATYTVLEEDLEQGSIVNTANVTGTDLLDKPVTASATATVKLSKPGLQLTKEASPETASADDTITYTYTIVNNGNVTVDNITLEDDKLGPISDNITLAAGDNVTATATYTVSEGDLEQGSIVNTATATGTDPDGNTLTASDTATVELTSSPPIEEPSIEVTKSADKTSATLGDNITYTYTITNTGNVTLFNVTLVDDKLPEVSLGSDNITLTPDATVIATGNHTVSIFDFFLRSTVVNTATVTSTDPNGKIVTASAKATVSISKTLFWKRDILQQSGVPGKGIENAPGLQKPFNPKSQAAEHAGKKDKPKTPEQLQIRERVENQGTEQQLQIQSEVENEAGSGQATQSDDEARPGNGQLKKNSVTDNQTQGQEATQGNGQNKPDKDKPKSKSKAGNQP